MNRYEELCIRQQKVFNGLPIAYAFTEDQLLDAMKKLGVKSHRALYSGPGGALYRKADSKLIRDTVNQLAKEKMELLLGSYEFAYDAFRYELANHEFCITHNPFDTLEALGLECDHETLVCKEMDAYPELFRAYMNAKTDYLADCAREEW